MNECVFLQENRSVGATDEGDIALSTAPAAIELTMAVLRAPL